MLTGMQFTKLSNLYKKAGGAYSAGDIKTALKLLDQALVIDPANKTILSFIGRINNPLTSDQKKQLIELNNQALDRYAAQDYQQALDLWKKVLAIRPEDIRVNNLIKEAEAALQERRTTEIANAFQEEKK